MLLLEDFILDEFGEDHSQFKSLLKYMLKIDPKQRPSASQCLEHPFFTKANFSPDSYAFRH